MQLRTKILLLIFVTMSALIGSLQWLLSSVLLDKFTQLELSSLSKDVRRAQKAFIGEPHQLALKQMDWSRSDTTYQFAEDQNAQFIQSNLSSFTLTNLELHDIAFFRSDGTLSFDLRQHTGDRMPSSDLDRELMDEIARHPELVQASAESREGYLVLPSGIFAFSLQQVLPSAGSSLPHGTILFTKLVDDAFVARLANQLELPLTLLRADMLPEKEAAHLIALDAPLEHRVVDAATIQGFGALRDGLGQRSLVLSLTEHRDIYQQGKATLAALFIGLIVAGVIVMVVIGSLIERTIINRLNSVANQVELIACSVDSSQTVNVEGDDELGVVASSINTMLRSLHTAEQQLREAKELAEQATEARAVFVANISHEVRTPINGVLGMAQVLLQLPLEPDQRQYVEMIRSASVSLLSVVNDVLDFSKIDSGKLELEQIPFQLGQLVYEALQSVALRAHEKGLELVCKPSCNIPQSLVGDPIRLRQILLNLLGNAIKFTEKGEVTLTVESEQLSQFGVRLHFLVRDTGIGIPKEKLGTIFEAFAQADGSTSRRFGGTGLGLTISREIVELMGGTIWATQAPLWGTEMHFTGVFGCDGEPETLPYDLLGRKVIVVDDNRCFLESVAETVATRGGVFESFLGLPPAERFKSIRSGEFIIVDAELIASGDVPRWREIASRAEGRFFFTVPMGRSDLLKDIRKSWHAGVMLKPILPNQLIESLLQGQREVGASRETERPPLSGADEKRQLTILVADDVGVNQQILRLMLEPQGHSVLFANNGREVLDFLSERGYCSTTSRPPVDLILMDAQMPVMDGAVAAGLIREREAEFAKARGEKVHLPIVAVTADAMTGERETLAESGMDEYLAKPIFAQDLLRKLEVLFQEKHGTDTVLSEVESSNAEKNPDLILDHSSLSARLGGREKIVHEMLVAYLEESSDLLGAVTAAVRRAEIPAVLTAVHAFRGSLSNVDAHRACVVADALKAAAEQNAFENLPALNDELIAAASDLEAEIREVLSARGENASRVDKDPSRGEGSAA